MAAAEDYTLSQQSPSSASHSDVVDSLELGPTGSIYMRTTAKNLFDAITDDLFMLAPTSPMSMFYFLNGDNFVGELYRKVHKSLQRQVQYVPERLADTNARSGGVFDVLTPSGTEIASGVMYGASVPSLRLILRVLYLANSFTVNGKLGQITSTREFRNVLDSLSRGNSSHLDMVKGLWWPGIMMSISHVNTSHGSGVFASVLRMFLTQHVEDFNYGGEYKHGDIVDHFMTFTPETIPQRGLMLVTALIVDAILRGKVGGYCIGLNLKVLRSVAPPARVAPTAFIDEIPLRDRFYHNMVLNDSASWVHGNSYVRLVMSEIHVQVFAIETQLIATGIKNEPPNDCVIMAAPVIAGDGRSAGLLLKARPQTMEVHPMIEAKDLEVINIDVRGVVSETANIIWTPTDVALFTLLRHLFSPEFDSEEAATYGGWGYMLYGVKVMEGVMLRAGEPERFTKGLPSLKVLAYTIGAKNVLWLSSRHSLYEKDASGLLAPIPEGIWRDRLLAITNSGDRDNAVAVWYLRCKWAMSRMYASEGYAAVHLMGRVDLFVK